MEIARKSKLGITGLKADERIFEVYFLQEYAFRIRVRIRYSAADGRESPLSANGNKTGLIFSLYNALKGGMVE